jgi:hypothetical protein
MLVETPSRASVMWDLQPLFFRRTAPCSARCKLCCFITNLVSGSCDLCNSSSLCYYFNFPLVNLQIVLLRQFITSMVMFFFFFLRDLVITLKIRHLHIRIYKSQQTSRIRLNLHLVLLRRNSKFSKSMGYPITFTLNMRTIIKIKRAQQKPSIRNQIFIPLVGLFIYILV